METSGLWYTTGSWLALELERTPQLHDGSANYGCNRTSMSVKATKGPIRHCPTVSWMTFAKVITVAMIAEHRSVFPSTCALLTA
jgi:hypothetical protein